MQFQNYDHLVYTSLSCYVIYNLDTAIVNIMRNQIFIAALNQVVLLGRVGGAPEKRGTEEHPVVTFSVATHTNYRKGEGKIVHLSSLCNCACHGSSVVSASS